MSRELSELNLQEDFAKVLACDDAGRWKLERGGELEVYIFLSSAAHPEEIFQVRLLWDEYPAHPPSLKFLDPATGRLDLKAAWPRVRGFRPENLDACVNWCAEGFALHPEWRLDLRLRWDSRGNVLLKVIRLLQDELDNYFDGRFRG